jgi:hemin uptake protein HemP
MPDPTDEEHDRDDAPSDGEPSRVFRAAELFGDSREVWIELDGVRYRLRITRRGKLILQK